MAGVEVRSVQRGIRMSAQKVRLVLEVVRGKPATRSAGDPQVPAEARRAAGRRGRALGRGQRRKQLQHGSGRSGDHALLGRRRPHAQALAPARPRPRQPDLEALEPHHRRGGREGRLRPSMGQKVHPIGFRLGIKVGDRSVKDWQGRWFATGAEYASLLLEDIKVRQHIMTAHGRRGRLQSRDRALGQHDHRHDPRRQAGHRHRQERRQGRRAAAHARGDDRRSAFGSPSRRSASPRSTPSWWRAASPISSKSASRSGAR